MMLRTKDEAAARRIAGDDRGGTILFSREARNATEAILSAIIDSEQSGLMVTGVMEDLVTVEDIAEKTSRSGPAVGHWITGERGPGGFPVPMIHRGSRIKLYSWAQVSAWLSNARLGQVDPAAAEVATAAAAAEIGALLHARQILRDAPSTRRAMLKNLIAA
ncbi:MULTISPECIES: hypothetical protein [unclassified Frankia]|uniref:hypothetical protein n=1 Tax=unclassified Frankia TaxID=2632575 RepID=UPI002AD3E310|nr:MULTISPECIES: hypothetical protein [unclassified Frankia]